MDIYTLALLVFLLNLPFGYLRGKSKRYSKKWFLYIHIPIPFVILLRIYSGLGFELYTFPWVIGAFFCGQFLGSIISKYLTKNTNTTE